MAWKLPTLARVANGWAMNTETLGAYGNYYLKRAILAQQGPGANVVEDAIYPLNLADDSGKPLDGANKYAVTFEKGATPPVDAFWSITLYDQDGFPGRQYAEPFCRQQLDAVQVQRGWIARSLFPECEPWQGSELASGAEGSFQSDDAAVHAEVGSADRQVESAAGRESADDGGHFGPMKVDRTPALRRRRPTARTTTVQRQEVTSC
jgi:hypothetical protein